jgi:hypothetical protein
LAARRSTIVARHTPCSPEQPSKAQGLKTILNRGQGEKTGIVSVKSLEKGSKEAAEMQEKILQAVQGQWELAMEGKTRITGGKSKVRNTRSASWGAHHLLDELSEGAGFSGRCPSGREHGPEIDPGQFPILQNMSRLSMNALCSCKAVPACANWPTAAVKLTTRPACAALTVV